MYLVSTNVCDLSEDMVTLRRVSILRVRARVKLHIARKVVEVATLANVTCKFLGLATCVRPPPHSIHTQALYPWVGKS